MPYYEQFITSVRSGRMISSIIVSGSEGVGSKLLALEMAKYYLCHNPGEHGPCGVCSSCVAFKRYLNQDLKVAYTSSLDEASCDLDFTMDCSGLITREAISQTRTMRVDTMRKISEYINESSTGGGRGKVVIIAGAESMSEAAANAILKTFEEPNPNNLIIMVASSLEALLPTILSRAAKVVIRDVKVEDSYGYLLNPANHKPVLLKGADEGDEEFYLREQEACSKCPGLTQPITQERAAVALALNSYAPLSAMNMLLSGADLKSINIIRALVQCLSAGDAYEVDTIATLKELPKLEQIKLLRALIIEVLKYKAYVPIETLPLVYYGNAAILERLPADHLFDAMDKLKIVDDQAPLIPSRAPVALMRAWIQGFKMQG